MTTTVDSDLQSPSFDVRRLQTFSHLRSLSMHRLRPGPVASFKPASAYKIPTLSSMSESLHHGKFIKFERMILTRPMSPTENFTSSNRMQEDPEGDQQSRSGAQMSSSGVESCLICPFDVKILTDQHGGNGVLGHGAWSTVFKATRQPVPSSMGPLTPPSSPVAPNPLLLAVKVPTRKDANPILEHEAKVLTYLSQRRGHRKHVIQFFGLIPKLSSLVLTAVPLSLEDHILSAARIAKQTHSTWTMSDPVVGPVHVWLSLAQKVVSALRWLHEEGEVVHGDIKPSNFLLSPLPSTDDSNSFPFEPLFIDFSSSHLIHSVSAPENSLSAITREYTAPELLSSSVLRDPKSTATRPSDVFSAAVTLLVAATGDTKVYAGSVFQRQAMATQGWQVIQLVRSGDQGSRIPSHGIVERALERAVLKSDMGRVTASQWRDVIDDLAKTDPSKEPS